MPKVKCRYDGCGKLIDKKDAVCRKHGKSNWYYCCVEHANSKSLRDIMYEQLTDIFGKVVTNTVLYKEFDELGKIYGYEKILAYIKENYQYLCMVMTKYFANDYNRIRYLSAIFKNSLGSFEMPKEEVKKDVEVEVEMFGSKYNNKKQQVGMDDLLNNLLED